MAESEVINNSVQFFEGVEKLLEIWFAPNEKNKMADLRKIPRLVCITENCHKQCAYFSFIKHFLFSLLLLIIY